jgi:hypothetical protein
MPALRQHRARDKDYARREAGRLGEHPGEMIAGFLGSSSQSQDGAPTQALRPAVRFPERTAFR